MINNNTNAISMTLPQGLTHGQNDNITYKE